MSDNTIKTTVESPSLDPMQKLVDQAKADEAEAAKAKADAKAAADAAKAKAKADKEKAKADAKAKADEVKAKAAADKKAKADEVKAKAAADKKAKADAKAKADEEAKAKREAKAKADEEAKAAREAKAADRAKAKAEFEARQPVVPVDPLSHGYDAHLGDWRKSCSGGKYLRGYCLCGCGQVAKSDFLPGHDAKLHVALTKAAKDGNEAAVSLAADIGWDVTRD